MPSLGSPLAGAGSASGGLRPSEPHTGRLPHDPPSLRVYLNHPLAVVPQVDVEPAFMAGGAQVYPPLSGLSGLGVQVLHRVGQGILGRPLPRSLPGGASGATV